MYINGMVNHCMAMIWIKKYFNNLNMKSITNFIYEQSLNEKLKLNSQSKLQVNHILQPSNLKIYDIDYIIDTIFEYFCYSDNIDINILEKIKKEITNWATTLKRYHKEYLSEPFIDCNYDVWKNDFKPNLLNKYTKNTYVYFRIINKGENNIYFDETKGNMRYILGGNKYGIYLIVGKDKITNEMCISFEYNF